MKKEQIQTNYSTFSSIEELESDEQLVINKAIQMLDAVYAPYSGFYVGAACMTLSENIYGGCNQENASYPLCICGERVALANAGSYEPRTGIKILAVVTHNPKNPVNTPASPCGACRQVLAEYVQRHKQDFVVLLKGDTDLIYKIESVSDLLPLAFDADFL